MLYEDIKDFFGGIYPASEALGVSKWALYRCKRIKYVPLSMQLLVEAKTKGALKHDILHSSPKTVKMYDVLRDIN